MDDKKIIFSMVNVSKTIPPQRQILKNIYLSFFYGAKIGVLGLNGAGKSTLLKIIAGLDKSFQGEVVFSPGWTRNSRDRWCGAPAIPWATCRRSRSSTTVLP